MNTPRRVAYLAPEYPGQTHTFIRREIDAMRGLGYAVEVFSTRRPPARIISHTWAAAVMRETTFLHPPVPGHVAAALRCLLLAGPARLARVLRALRDADVPDTRTRLRLVPLAFYGAVLAGLALRRGLPHIHVHMCGDVANVALFAHLLSGIPYSLTMHNSLREFGPNQRQKWRHASFGVAISKRHRQEALEELGPDAPPVIAVAPMGVVVEKYGRTAPYEPWDGREEPRIFCCGRLNPQKNHPDLIRAVRCLLDRGLGVRLTIAGGDDTPQAVYRREIEDLAAALGIADRVRLLGAVSEETVRDELGRAHVYAMASRHEGVPVSVMEAMAMALPVAVTDVGGMRELIDHGENGLLAPAESPQALAANIGAILADPHLALRFSQSGRARIERDFDSRRCARTVAALLEGRYVDA